jgi:hypothetical protein
LKVLLFQLDGDLPNLALMRISAYHKALGDDVELRHGAAFRALWDEPDRVYASLIFERTKPLAREVLQNHPGAIIGGTGWDVTRTLADVGIADGPLDYTIYPQYRDSVGFTQRGCRLRCSFCVVPKKEGAIRETATAQDIWRGDPWPRNLVLLDNDFFGQPNWRARIAEIRDGGFKVSFNQGINARFLDDEAAEAIASVKYYNGKFTARRIYTAWDNLKDEARLFDGLNRLVKYGVKPDHVMVYMLCGYWAGETQADREYRRKSLRDFGARPYPMPYTRTPELVGFQRWVVGAYDKRFSWEEWMGAKYRPEKLGQSTGVALPILQ